MNRLEQLERFVDRIAEYFDYTHDDVNEVEILHTLQAEASKLHNPDRPTSVETVVEPADPLDHPYSADCPCSTCEKAREPLTWGPGEEGFVHFMPPETKEDVPDGPYGPWLSVGEHHKSGCPMKRPPYGDKCNCFPVKIDGK